MSSKTATHAAKPASSSITTQAQSSVFRREVDKQPENPLQQSIWQPSLPGAGAASPPPATSGHNFANIPVLAPTPINVQARLTVGEPNDKYEQEADAVADQVMRMPEPIAQGRSDDNDDEEKQQTIQTKPVAERITPLIQRETFVEADDTETVQGKSVLQRQLDAEEVDEEEEETAQAEPVIQRQLDAEEVDEEESLQTKPLLQRQEQDDEEEGETVQAKPVVQRQTEAEEEDEEPLQAKTFIQRQEQEQDEEEETASLQTKAAGTKTPRVSRDNESYIDSIRGKGQPLPQEERDFFEPRFAHNFGRIRIHADGQAARAARQIHAQAFTVGNNIFFGANRYQPATKPGRQLLAHELTHTVQQMGRQPLSLHGAVKPDLRIALPQSARPLEIPRTWTGVSRLMRTAAKAETPEVKNQVVLGLVDRAVSVLELDPESHIDEISEQIKETDPAQRQEIMERLRSLLVPATFERVNNNVGGVSTEERESTASVTGDRKGALENAEKAAEETASSPEAEYTRSIELAASPENSDISAIKDTGITEEPSEETVSTEEQKTLTAAQNLEQVATETTTSEEAAESKEEQAVETTFETESGTEAQAGETKTTANPETVASEILTGLSGSQAVLASLKSSRVQFIPRTEAENNDPRELSRRTESESIASGFLARVGAQIEKLIAAAINAVPRISASANSAGEKIDGVVSQGKSELASHIGEQNEQVKKETAVSRRHISKGETDVIQAVDGGAKSARESNQKAHDDANNELGKQKSAQITEINTLYTTWQPKYRKAGIDAGAKAKQMGNEKANQWLSQRNGESSLLDGPIHDNRLEAKADAAHKVSGEYQKSFVKSGDEQANKIMEARPGVIEKVDEIAGKVKEGLTKQLESVHKSVDSSKEQGREQTQSVTQSMDSATDKSMKATVDLLQQQESIQVERLSGYGDAQKQSLDGVAAESIQTIGSGVNQAVGSLNQSMQEFSNTAATMEAPDPSELSPLLNDTESQSQSQIESMEQQLAEGAGSSENGIAAGGEEAVSGLNLLVTNAQEQAGVTARSYGESAEKLRQQASQGFGKLKEASLKTLNNIAKGAQKAFKDSEAGMKTSFKSIGEKTQESLKAGSKNVEASLWSKENQGKLENSINTHAEEAAAKVQPRWKSVLKWIITIVVIIAVIAITILSAGALGPVGLVLLGATLGALAGAAIQIGHNLVDGEKWSKGVVKQMIVGAIGGAFGGLGGVIFKGIGTVALKIGLEVGLDVIGGIIGEVAGSLIVGESINWTNAVIGALIGAGIGAGLGIGGAIRGKFKPKVDVDVPTTVKPGAEVPTTTRPVTEIPATTKPGTEVSTTGKPSSKSRPHPPESDIPVRRRSNVELEEAAVSTKIGDIDHTIKPVRVVGEVKLVICTTCGTLTNKIDDVLKQISPKGPTKSLHRRLTNLKNRVATVENNLNNGTMSFNRIPAEANQIGAHLNNLARKHPQFGASLNTGKLTRPSSSDYADLATRNGFRSTGATSHGQAVYTDGRIYISPDVDSHIGGVWKAADTVRNLGSKRTRMGTYDADMNKIGD